MVLFGAKQHDARSAEAFKTGKRPVEQLGADALPPMVRIDDLNEDYWTRLLVAQRRVK